MDNITCIKRIIVFDNKVSVIASGTDEVTCKVYIPSKKENLLCNFCAGDRNKLLRYIRTRVYPGTILHERLEIYFVINGVNYGVLCDAINPRSSFIQIFTDTACIRTAQISFSIYDYSKAVDRIRSLISEISKL